jgi:hypothetical protein
VFAGRRLQSRSTPRPIAGNLDHATRRRLITDAHAPLNPDVANLAPSDPELTSYDEEHAITYVRMLDTDADSI